MKGRCEHMEREIASMDLEAARMRGPGGAPTRATTLPEDAKARREFPIASGVLDYFPDAIVAVWNLSKAGNDQHNPGQPLDWARGKSSDGADTRSTETTG